MSYVLVMDVDADGREERDREHPVADGMARAGGRLVRVVTSCRPHQVGIWMARLAAAEAAGLCFPPMEFVPVHSAEYDRIGSDFAAPFGGWGQPEPVGDVDHDLYVKAKRVLTGELTFPDPTPPRRNVTRAAVNPAKPVISLQQGLRGLDEPIPRIIHMAWLGMKPLSDLNRRCIQSWREHHPGWEIKFWCDEGAQLPRGMVCSDIGVFPTVTGDLCRAAANLGEATDILRLEILRLYGGVWVDCDMECFRPIDDLPQRGFFTSMGPHGSYLQLENALMGACPGHPIVEAMVRALPLWTAVFPDAAVIYRAGPVYVDYWCRVWMGRAFGAQKSKAPVSANSVTVLPMEWFFHPIGREAALREGCGYHHGTGSWINP